MIRLTTAELRRLLARRTTRGIALAGVVLLLLSCTLVVRNSRPPTPAEVTATQAAYEQAMVEWKRTGEQQIESCEASNRSQAEAGVPPMDCSLLEPRLQNYGPYHHTISELTDLTPMALAIALGLFWAAIAASFVGTEFTTGSMATWLLVEPRRRLVHASKLTAVAIVAAVSAVLATALTLVAWWVVGSINDYSFTLTTHQQAVFAAQTGRMVLAVTAGAMVAASLAFLLRTTAGAFAALALWGMVTTVFTTTSRLGWLSLGNNLYAWIVGRATYSWASCGQSTGCAYRSAVISQPEAACYAVATLLLALLLGWLGFRRRDVG